MYAMIFQVEQEFKLPYGAWDVYLQRNNGNTSIKNSRQYLSAFKLRLVQR